MEQIIAQVIGGALGGAGTGKAVKSADMGSAGNLIVGALGGLGGGQLLDGLLNSGTAAAASGVDFAALASNLVGGGVAGAIVQVVVGMVVRKLRGA